MVDVVREDAVPAVEGVRVCRPPPTQAYGGVGKESELVVLDQGAV